MPTSSPSPSRQAAGRANRAKRGPLTPSGLKRLRAAVLRTKPWLKTTGPATAAGKARSAANGRVRQTGPISTRQMRAQLAEVRQMITEMRTTQEACRSD